MSTRTYYARTKNKSKSLPLDLGLANDIKAQSILYLTNNIDLEQYNFATVNLLTNISTNMDKKNVAFINYQSGPLAYIRGVPQRFILEPLLFLISFTETAYKAKITRANTLYAMTVLVLF